MVRQISLSVFIPFIFISLFTVIACKNSKPYQTPPVSTQPNTPDSPGQNDNNNNTPDTEKGFARDVEGAYFCDFIYSPEHTETKEIVLTAETEKTIVLIIKNFSFASSDISDFAIPGIIVIQKTSGTADNELIVHNLSGKQEVPLVIQGKNIPACFEIAGEISGETIRLTLSVTLNGNSSVIAVSGTKRSDEPSQPDIPEEGGNSGEGSEGGSEENPPVPEEDYASYITGEYKGDLKIEQTGTSAVYTQEVTLVSKGINKIELTIGELIFNGTSLGTVTLPDLAVSEIPANESRYQIKGRNEITVSQDGFPTVLSINITGSSNGSELIFNATASITATDRIDLSFNGTTHYIPSSEAAILSIALESPYIQTQYFDIAGNSFYYYPVSRTSQSELRNIEPVIAISPKATIRTSDGRPADLSREQTTYIVTAEDGITRNQYTLIKVAASFSDKTDFPLDSWTNFSAYSSPIDWETLNKQLSEIHQSSPDITVEGGDFPVKKITGQQGSAAELTTLSLKTGASQTLLPGLLFTGTTTSTLSVTSENISYGILYNGKRPLALKGYYSYAPGTEYYENGHTVTSKKDEGAVIVVLYQVNNPSDKKEILRGAEILSAPNIIAKGVISFSETSYPSFSPFNIPLTYLPGKDYNPSKAFYRLAIIATSSNDLTFSKGAPGSKLLIDELNLKIEIE